MATYFHGSNSEIQSPPPSAADGLQTLYLMNPNFHAPYSDAPHQHQQPATPNMLLLNPNAATHHAHAHALNLANFSHAPQPQSPNQQHHHFVPGVSNILGSSSSDDHSRPSLFGHHDVTTAFHGFPAAAPPRVHYNLWGSVVNEAQPSTPSSSSGAAASDLSPQIGFRRPSQQGLSLTLSSQQQQQQQQQTANSYMPLSGEVGGGVGNSPSSVSNGMSSVHGVILGSKYLKAAQELLDEVVNVGNYKEEMAEKGKGNRESTSGIGEGSNGGGNGGGGGGENSDARKLVAELSTAQRQELQMKKSKLVTMLDEVEQRYRQYHHQMMVVISSFEQAAGFGAAKSYTSLALKTISKQFRCLKDAITSQIKAASKAMGEDDCLGAKVEGSRLRYVDHHLRQQRALQQLGMIQPNAWRPQRGLPERAVSILRAWLFEHFLHPYPKDSDKVMLAKQTGLTRGQVSNWFINARVRLWKPMVEEMYLEEIKDQEHNNNNNNGSDNNGNIKSKEPNKELLGSTSNNNNNNAAPESSSAIKLDHINIHHLQSKQQQQQQQQECFNNNNNQQSTTSPTASSSIMSTSLQSHTGFHHQEMQIKTSTSPNKTCRIGASEMQHSPSSILSMEHMEMKHNIGDHREEVANNTKFSYGAAFSMDDIGTRFNFTDHHHHQLASSRFQGNNGVSLTLGLPHNNNNNNESRTISGTQQQQQQHGFLSQNNMHGLGRRLEINGTNVGNEFCVINSTTPPVPQSSHSGATNYESIDIQNRKRFAAQLLPDFVA